ncbi:MAG TPA: FAD-dependent thymidylate synthase [Acidimicrobiales bacterium]|nr:FAD-dependent thymidylate synthase [Acidimicrobiales bacterium]
MAYVRETFTEDERDVLRHYVTNLDGPVFALVNLPEVVKGALFARYSRSPKSLRRLFLDEFVDDLDVSGDIYLDATMGLRRAEELYARVFGEYGDDSVAQLGGVHLACEQASNILTKVLERGRLMSYLEQSTRYIPYDTRMPSGHYRYYRDPDVLESPLGARYVGEMDRMFDTYGELLPRLEGHLRRSVQKPDAISDFAYRQSVRAAALDSLRGLLPAGALSNVGIYGSGQAYEMLLLRMRAHPSPEVRGYAELMLVELNKVIPSFLTRLDRPDRGGEWVEYLGGRRDEMTALAALLFPDEPAGAVEPSVRLVDFDPAGEEKVLAAMCYPYTGVSDAEVERRVAALTPAEREELVAAYVGSRQNRRHRPGRAFERTSYRFDVVSDYGAFRDLQRHRMLTIEWQPLTTTLGYGVPPLVAEAGLEDEFVASLERSRELHGALEESFPEQCSYAVALAFNIRYSLQLSAREAMHVTELRSGPQGHPAYRVIAQQMHRAIAEQAGHRALAAAMSFVDHGEVELGRLDAEQRLEVRRGGGGGAVSGPGTLSGGGREAIRIDS